MIRFNYMSHPDDWADFRHCIRLTREIFGQAAFDPYRGKEISPGAHVQSDDELDDFIREHAESAYHPCGTCRMGARRRPDERRRSANAGSSASRACASPIPRSSRASPTAISTAPSIMTGEKAADHILGRTPLAPSNQEPWINPRWQTSDR